MVNVKCVEIFYFFLKTKGFNSDDWLKQANIKLIDLQHSHSKLTLFQITRLIQSALNYFPNYDLGLEFGELLDIYAYGNLSQLVLSSDTLGTALTHINRYFSIITHLVHFSIAETHNNSYSLLFKPLFGNDKNKINRFLIETAFASWHQIRKTLLKQESLTCHLYLNYQPYQPERFYRYFGPQIHFNQTVCEYHFPLSDKNFQLDRPNPVIQQMTTVGCERELSLCAQSDSYAIRLKQWLLSQANKSFCLTQAAKTFCVSERTLKRKLQLEQTSFQKILDEARQILAIDFLKQKKLSREDIAMRLGYSDSASFLRAFKRWFKQSPSKFLSQR